MRVDIRARKTLKEENFHKDGVALAHPQLHAFKLRGDEGFRLAVYQRGVNLTEKPHMVLKGHVEIGGSVNMLQYLFSKEDVEKEFGDSSYEDGKQFIFIKRKGNETKHEIKPCYWLDLIKG